MGTAYSRIYWTVALMSVSAAALAQTPKTAPPQEPMGFIAGGVIGGLALGPVGAVVGAGVGTWLGNRVRRADDAEKATSAVETQAAGDEAARVLDGLHGDVLFRSGSAEVTPEMIEDINVLAEAVAKSPALKVRVDGYTDPRGTADANLKLSAARAAAVRDLFLAAGVSETALEVNAYGKSRSSAADSDGYALERRVRLTLQAANPGEVAKSAALAPSEHQ